MSELDLRICGTDLNDDLAGPPAIVIDGDDRIHVVTAAHIQDAAPDWAEARDVVTAPDRVFIRGRYVHGGLPANRNGHIFRTEQLVDAHLRIPNTPLNMLHRTHHVLGSFVATRLVHPAEAVKDAAQDYTETPYVESLAVMWRYAFPDEYAAVKTAHDMGMSFLSCEGVPQANTCPTCDATFPWKGYVHDSYCGHLNQPRAPRWIEDPLFVGGAVVIPPARPGWKDASITRIASYLEAHPSEAENVYQQVAATAPHLDARDVEAVMAALVSHAHPKALEVDPRTVIAPLWDALTGRYPDLDFTPPADVADKALVALATAPADVPAPVLHRARNLAAGRPQPPATVRRIAQDLTMWRPTSQRLFDLWGGDRGLEWAQALVDAMDAADAPVATSKPAHTSAVLVLRPAPDVAEALSAVGGIPVGEIHVTLVFFRATDGDVLLSTDITRSQIADAVTSVVTGRDPLTAEVNGQGLFHEHGKDVTWAAVDCPGLAELYSDLVEALDTAGIPFSRDHGFTAHSTVAITEPGAGPTDVPSGLSWQVDSVELWWGDDQTGVIPFATES